MNSLSTLKRIVKTKTNQKSSPFSGHGSLDIIGHNMLNKNISGQSVFNNNKEEKVNEGNFLQILLKLKM